MRDANDLSLEQRARSRIDAANNGARRWLAVRMRPQPPLNAIVQWLWFVAGACVVRARLPPIVGVDVVVNLGDPYDVSGPDALRVTTPSGAWIEGLRDRWLGTDAHGATTLIGARLSPTGAFMLLGRATGELGNRVVDAVDVLGAEVARLRERLGEARTLSELFRTLESYLTQRWRRRIDADRRSIWACDRLVSGSHANDVQGLSRRMGLSHARFTELLRAQTGLTPKRLARIGRFHRVLQALSDRSTVDWSRLALEHGFFDQAHLVREFGSMAGCSPTQFLRRRDSLSQSVSIWDQC